MIKYHNTKITGCVFALLLVSGVASGQQNDSVEGSYTLKTVSVSHKRSNGVSSLGGVENGVRIGKDELFKAACCNLGESFATNASTDVSYTDATAGTKQIKLLGLNGIYIQMLSENIPDFGGNAMPYALDFVPGQWMKSISLSKGCSSVAHGYESVTGQIDIEYLKPQDPVGGSVTLYGNSMGRVEANADANLHINDRLSTVLMLHGNKDFARHDSDNDGFADFPSISNFILQNRWRYSSSNYIFHGGFSVLRDGRQGGQLPDKAATPFNIDLTTKRHTAYMKHAYIFDRAHETNLALTAYGAANDFDGVFGFRAYTSAERNVRFRLAFETHSLNDAHALSAGFSLKHTSATETLHALLRNSPTSETADFRETVPGTYLQYTFSPSHKITMMAGIRADHSSLFGFFFTPRLHIKTMPTEWLTIRASAGKGYLSERPLAANHYLLSSGRDIVVDTMVMDNAWNLGLSASINLKIFDKYLKISTDYYYTDFLSQNIVDYETSPSAIHLTSLDGQSFSHALQIDAAYPIIADILEITSAYRFTDVKTTYNGTLMEKPLTSRNKALVTLSAKTGLGIWQFDATLQINGGGRMPKPRVNAGNGEPLWNERFEAYAQFNMQVTRWFRHCSVYAGVENLTNCRQPNPIINANDPWSIDFEPTLVWGPTIGIMAYAGFRYNFGKRQQ